MDRLLGPHRTEQDGTAAPQPVSRRLESPPVGCHGLPVILSRELGGTEGEHLLQGPAAALHKVARPGWGYVDSKLPKPLKAARSHGQPTIQGRR